MILFTLLVQEPNPRLFAYNSQKNQIEFSLYSSYYVEACNEWRGPSPRLSVWATQLRRNIAAVASRWRHCVDLTGSEVEPLTSRTDSVRLATELTAGCLQLYFSNINHTQVELSVTSQLTRLTRLSFQ